MPGWIRRVAAGLMPPLALAGCGLPAGVDGDLTGGWSSFPEPVQMLPEVGVCHNHDYQPTVQLGIYYQPRECTEPHMLETVHVGAFEGDVALRETPPEPGTSAWRSAYRECDTAAADYLGADFRYGQLWLGVSVPTEAAWRGEARWFRCDLVDWETPDLPAIGRTSRQGLLADDASEQRLGCFTVEVGDETGEVVEVLDMLPVPCDEPHIAEFVGVWHSDQSSYPESEAAQQRVLQGCWSQIASYVGVPDDSELTFRTGSIFDHILDEDWENGDRGFRCYLWLDREVSRSLAGAGPRGLPIR